MGQWVNFDQIKKTPGVMKRVLEFYGLLDNMKEKGKQLTGICPIHKGTNKTEFSVNTQKSIWQCFSCKAKGDVINFVEAMEGVGRREAALKIAKWLGISSNKEKDRNRKKKKLVREEDKNGEYGANDGGEKYVGSDWFKLDREEKEEKKEVINPPLRFQLQNIDPDHPYLKDRVLPETIRHFGLGLCKKGIMKDRIVIPIHNEKGELVAYAGRWPGDPPEGEGKYKLPPKFQKSFVVFNLHRAKDFIQEHGLILVEGYFAVFKLWQAGFANSVALMGSQMSKPQEKLIIDAIGPNGKVILLFDNDEAGLNCRQDVSARLLNKCFVRAVDLPNGVQQIDSLEDQKIRDLLSF